MSVTLTDEEVVAVRAALDNYLPELQHEAARTKLSRGKPELVSREETLLNLRKRLSNQ